jgi:uncharacterized protein
VKVLFVVIAAALLGRLQPAAAVPPPPEQSAANCDTPTYASDLLVCADPSLLALDRRMVGLLAGRSAPPKPALHWFEAQEAWFRRRSLCAFSERHAACLRAAYTERIDLLTALAGAPSGQRSISLGAICPDAPWGNGAILLHAPDRGPLTMEDGRGQVLVVASALKPQDDWTPFVRFRSEGKTILVEPSGGTVLRCRTSSALRNPSPADQRVP